MSLSHPARQRISPAFVRRTGWAAALATLAIVGIYVVLAGRAVDRQRRDDLRATAEIVAAALGKPGEQFVRQADRLLSRAGALAAVGTTDAAGRVQMLLPDRPEYQQAAALALASPGEAVPAGVASGTNGAELWGVALPSNIRSGSGAPESDLVLLFTPRTRPR